MREERKPDESGVCTTPGIFSPSLSSSTLSLPLSFLFFFFFSYNLPRRRADMHGDRKSSEGALDDKRASPAVSERRTCVGIKSVTNDRSAIM